jgi:hypothetical protein
MKKGRYKDLPHSVGRIYPWQVAPQQSLLPFRFNFAKINSTNYIYNLSKKTAIYLAYRKISLKIKS